jgi:sensor histidine kinase YesM
MTIINSYYKKPTISLSNTNFVKPKHLKNVLKSKLNGSISISLPIVAICLFAFIITSYVIIYSNLHEYDYKIYTIKKEVQKVVDENNGLKESEIKNISPDKIAE